MVWVARRPLLRPLRPSLLLHLCKDEQALERPLPLLAEQSAFPLSMALPYPASHPISPLHHRPTIHSAPGPSIPPPLLFVLITLCYSEPSNHGPTGSGSAGSGLALHHQEAPLPQLRHPLLPACCQRAGGPAAGGAAGVRLRAEGGAAQGPAQVPPLRGSAPKASRAEGPCERLPACCSVAGGCAGFFPWEKRLLLGPGRAKSSLASPAGAETMTIYQPQTGSGAAHLAVVGLHVAGYRSLALCVFSAVGSNNLPRHVSTLQLSS